MHALLTQSAPSTRWTASLSSSRSIPHGVSFGQGMGTDYVHVFMGSVPTVSGVSPSRRHHCIPHNVVCQGSSVLNTRGGGSTFGDVICGSLRSPARQEDLPPGVIVPPPFRTHLTVSESAMWTLELAYLLEPTSTMKFGVMTSEIFEISDSRSLHPARSRVPTFDAGNADIVASSKFVTLILACTYPASGNRNFPGLLRGLSNRTGRDKTG